MGRFDVARTRVRALALAHASITASMAQCLHEPPHVARRLAWRTIARSAYDAAVNRRRFAQITRGERLDLRASDVERARLATFARWVMVEPAPKLVATIHSGDWLASALEAFDALPTGSRVHLPVPARSLDALAPVARLAAGLGKRLQFLPLKSASQLRLRRLDGADVIFILLDLDGSYGRTVDASLFDEPVRIVAGPYALAQRLRASIVYLHHDHGELEFDPPHDACVLEVQPGLNALARRFAARIERSIANAPTRWSRWHTWPLLQAKDRAS